MRTGRIVVITGGAGGIGSALVERFLVEGDTVVAVDCDAAALAALTTAHPQGSIATVVADVADEADCTRMAEEIAHQHGRVDVLVHCAGYFPVQPFEELPPDDWRRVVAINLTGPFLVTRALLPLFKGRGWGRIVCIGSASVFEGVPGQVHYVAAKAGVLGFARSLAREVGRHGQRRHAGADSK